MGLATRLIKLARLLAHPVYRAGLRHRVAATTEHESALRPLRLATVVDVGANKGQFSLLVRRLFPGARIIAFEPLPAAFSRYKQLFSDDGLVTLHEVALGEHGGSSTINVSARLDSSSLLPISAVQEATFPGTSSVGTATIEVARGDDILAALDLPRPLLIKLDVQGYEVAALRGLTATLDRTDYIYVEVSFIELYSGQPLADDVITFMHDRGFRLAGIYNPTFRRDGIAVQADMLFSRKDPANRHN